jgi:predicted ATP-binding protein involved in virulence
MTQFDNISIAEWRQFKSIEINFNKQVTILTGQNSSGKTTILNLLGKHFGWNIDLISTPYLSKKKRKRMWSDVIRSRSTKLSDDSNETVDIGSIVYNDGNSCKLSTPRFVSAQYQLQFQNQQPVEGLHIPSHRPAIAYQKISQIPTDPKTVQEQYQEFQQLLFQTYGSANVRNPGIILKQSLVSLALFGYGNQAVTANTEYKELFEDFQEILRDVLPGSLGFKRLEIRMPDVILITETGDFSIDAMSGGVNDLLGMAWQIHMFGANKDSCTVIIDEPENHLHPSLQRAILPTFAKAFGYCKFIVATHSPFIVSSMPSASVFGLVYNQNSKVESMSIQEADLSGTPNTILREILDVPSNLPIWVEDKIKTILVSYAKLKGEEKIRKILAELDQLGLSDKISEISLD